MKIQFIFSSLFKKVDAFGPVGVEGPFRLACEIGLSVMRREKDLILSVLGPFVLDPLLEWTDKARAGGDQQLGRAHLQRVEDRLSGFITRKKKTLQSQPLSVEGQVNHLITEATDLNNLVRICHLSVNRLKYYVYQAVMYWGWAPYL